MWSALIKFVEVSAGLFLVLGIWYAIQMFVRYKTGCGQDRDLLEFMAHGCSGCKGPGSCDRTTHQREHHYESL